MTQFTVIPGGRHGQAGYYAVADLPQKEPVGKSAVSSGWDEFDQIFRLYPEQFVAVTGRAGSGKSTFIFNLVVNYARLHGIRSFLYVPENEARLRGKLRKIWNDEGTADEFLRGMAFVQSAVPEHYDDEPKTLPWVLDQAVTAVRQDGVDLLVIDPWNELEWARPRDMSQTEYVRECLMWLKQFNRAYNTSTILVVHPTKEGLKDGKIPSLVDCEGCYSDDTEVLTRRGWVHHDQITLSDDVACFDPVKSSVEYHHPSRVLRKEYDGEMFGFRGLGYDLLVTPQHRMVVKPKWCDPVGENNGRGRPVRFPKGKWSFCAAENLSGSPFALPLSGLPLRGDDQASVQIGSRSYPAEAFWRLVGWYVAEGYIHQCGMTWSQAEGKIADQFTKTFAEAGIPASIGWQNPYGKGKVITGRWYIGNRFCPELVRWFRKNCGEGAAFKKIPDSVFKMSERMKLVFLSAYLDGDGSRTASGSFTATTISRRLSDDLQRLAVELGIPTGFSIRPAIGNAQQAFVVRFGRYARRNVSLRIDRNSYRQHYTGIVWCLTVPTGAYFVRRNGCVAVCGNSLSWHNKCDNGLIVHREKDTNTTRVISQKVREEPDAGSLGECWFTLDRATDVYTPQYGAVSTL